MRYTKEEKKNNNQIENFANYRAEKILSLGNSIVFLFSWDIFPDWNARERKAVTLLLLLIRLSLVFRWNAAEKWEKRAFGIKYTRNQSNVNSTLARCRHRRQKLSFRLFCALLINLTWFDVLLPVDKAFLLFTSFVCFLGVRESTLRHIQEPQTRAPASHHKKNIYVQLTHNFSNLDWCGCSLRELRLITATLSLSNAI